MQRVLPSYDGACLSNIVPALLGEAQQWPSWIPEIARDASQVVLLVIDALGWEQLGERAAVAPTLSAMEGGPITSVSPSTTSVALTSITTGRPPGEHGVVGYRMAVDGEILNSLRWTTAQGDARLRLNPAEFQPLPVFCGQEAVIIGKGEFESSGFTSAHLRDARYVGYRTMSGIVVEVDAELRRGSPFVFAYYDGIDRVAHEFGFGQHYSGELQAVDRLVADLIDVLPRGAVLLVTADHGQVDCAGSAIVIEREVTEHVVRQSGEARFRWLHLRDGTVDHVVALARQAHGSQAWIHTVDEVVEQGWFGPVVQDFARARLGDVAIVAKENNAFVDPNDKVPIDLIGRHGSLTSAEMYVPLLAAWR
ncbi:MAG: alkaline phosphatase family protein [Acidimicrobiales bacterium]